ncbi:hypothetical protein RDI58_003019 [Solanum bulbocastanum]|uniref:Uncharacterized protein n=1 Tax=Solanum bulbocastanum TaxID=147425 RepID=A0AAN8U7N2_SOLBU
MALREFFMHATTILSNHILEYYAQVHRSKLGEEFLEVVLVDEEAIGTADTVRCGAKILRGGGGLENIFPPTGSTMTMACLLSEMSILRQFTINSSRYIFDYLQS